MIKRNQYDKTGSALALGQQAEDAFIVFAQKLGYEVKPATLYQDTRQHIDYILIKNGQRITVDVKSEKKISRQDNQTQTELIWLEFMNVRGDAGWLHGSADYIAFQDGDEYLMIPREALLERANLLVTDKVARNASDALYKQYTRFGRQDLLAVVKKSDIVDLHESILSN